MTELYTTMVAVADAIPSGLFDDAQKFSSLVDALCDLSGERDTTRDRLYCPRETAMQVSHSKGVFVRAVTCTGKSSEKFPIPSG